MRSFCFEIIYGILLIVQKGHSTPDGQRVALNVRPLQPKRFFLAKPAVQTEGAEYAGAWFYDYTHQNIDLIGKQSLFLFRFSVRGDFDTLSRIINNQMIQTCFLKKLAHAEQNKFAELLAEVIMGMEQNPDQDFLGELYMLCELGNDASGQFFTPYDVCRCMVEISGGSDPAAENAGFFSVSDPACGAGALLIAFANLCRRKNILCDEFLRGTQDAGHKAEKIRVAEKKVAPCSGCYYCSTHGGACVHKDDMADILQKMIDADVIVLASPVYFYSISAQLKAVIDRTVARWLEVKDKEFYYITTMADEEKASADTTLTCFRGYADCVEGAVEKGVLVASGVYEPGAVRNTSAMAQAYEMGRNV